MKGLVIFSAGVATGAVGLVGGFIGFCVYLGKKYSDETLTVDALPSGSHNVSEVILTNRDDAEAVIDELCRILDTYGEVSVADLYDAVGINAVKFTDQKWGWTNLRSASVLRVREGYLLDLPKTLPLGNK